MTDQSDAPGATVDLISAYRSALRQRKLVRVTIACVILIIFVVYIGLMWITAVDFRTTGLPIIRDQLNTEIRGYLPHASKELREAANRVIPVYTKAFADTFEQNQELYAQTVLEEFEKLGEYAKLRTPLMEEAIAQLVEDQQQAANDALKGILTEDQFAEMSVAYDEALRDELQVVIDKHFREHIEVGEEIMQKLQAIAEADKGTVPEDNQVIMGMMVELLGLDMQLQGQPLANELETGEDIR